MASAENPHGGVDTSATSPPLLPAVAERDGNELVASGVSGGVHTASTVHDIPSAGSTPPWGTQLGDRLETMMSISTAPSDSLRTPMTPSTLARPFELGALADERMVSFTQSPATMSPAMLTHKSHPFRQSHLPNNNTDKGGAFLQDDHPRSVATSSKHRPSPLEITSRDPVDIEAAQLTGGSTHSSLSSDLMDLSTLRKSVHQNLRERPLNVTITDSDGESISSGIISPVDSAPSLTAAQTIALVRSSPQFLMADIRPLDDFLAGHLHGAANFSIPSLILNRLRHQTVDICQNTWVDLARFVSTVAGQTMWESIDVGKHVDVVVVGDEMDEDRPRALAAVLAPLVTIGTVSVLHGGWAAIAEHAHSSGLVVMGEQSVNVWPRSSSTSSSMSAKTITPTQALTVMTPSPEDATMISPIATSPVNSSAAPAPSQTGVRSVSALRIGSPRRTLPSLSMGPSPTSPGRRPPRLQLNLDNAKAAGKMSMAPPLRSGRLKPAQLTIDVGSSRLSPASSPGAHSSGMGLTPRAAGMDTGGLPTAYAQPHLLTPIQPSANYPTHPSSPGLPMSLSTPPARVQLPIEISTILPSFLYLGPEITTHNDVEELLALGVRRILNVAIECDDDEGLGLRTKFERYYRIPMKDTVEESGVNQGIREACKLLDDARLHSAPVYVHCKAGKSRSVTAVLAYLIHANAWTLQTSYQYVSQRRRGISPNIGFVAELMEFEAAELGHKQSAGVHGEADLSKSQPAQAGMGGNDDDEPLVAREPRVGPRYTRESLPPEFGSERLIKDDPASPVDELPEHTPDGGHGRRGRVSHADIEIRKNGQWVHRRAPVDRTTLQPGRRVSKAGLESMVVRPLARAED